MKNNNLEFRLQTVLNVVEHQENVVKNDLFKIRQQKNEEENLLMVLYDEKENAVYENSITQRANVCDFQVNVSFINSISNKIETQEKKIEEILTQESSTRGKLVDKRKSKHMLEILQKTHEEKIQKEQDIKLQKTIDELAISKRGLVK